MRKNIKPILRLAFETYLFISIFTTTLSIMVINNNDSDALGLKIIWSLIISLLIIFRVDEKLEK